jgi:hypothetical protein
VEDAVVGRDEVGPVEDDYVDAYSHTPALTSSETKGDSTETE